MGDFAVRLKQYRNEAGLTLESMGQALGMKSTNYAKYESEIENRMPREDNMINIAKVLGVSFSDLKYGRERNFVELLNRYLISVALGEADALDAYIADVMDYKPYKELVDLCDRYGEILAGGAEAMESGDFTPFYEKYLAASEYQLLVELCKRYRYAQEVDNGNAEPEEWFNEYDFDALYSFEPGGTGEQMSFYHTYKAAFLYAVTTYLDVCNLNEIVDEVRQAEGRDMSDTEAMQLFAIQVFVPYIAIVIRAFENMAMNNVPCHQLESFLFYD